MAIVVAGLGIAFLVILGLAASFGALMLVAAALICGANYFGIATVALTWKSAAIGGLVLWAIRFVLSVGK